MQQFTFSPTPFQGTKGERGYPGSPGYAGQEGSKVSACHGII